MRVKTRDPIADLLASMDAELATITDPAERRAWLSGVADTIVALQLWHKRVSA